MKRPANGSIDHAPRVEFRNVGVLSCVCNECLHQERRLDRRLANQMVAELRRRRRDEINRSVGRALGSLIP